MSNMLKSIINNVLEDVNSKMSSLECENSAVKDRVTQLEQRVKLLEKQGNIANLNPWMVSFNS